MTISVEQNLLAMVASLFIILKILFADNISDLVIFATSTNASRASSGVPSFSKTICNAIRPALIFEAVNLRG